MSLSRWQDPLSQHATSLMHTAEQHLKMTKGLITQHQQQKATLLQQTEEESERRLKQSIFHSPVKTSAAAAAAQSSSSSNQKNINNTDGNSGSDKQLKQLEEATITTNAIIVQAEIIAGKLESQLSTGNRLRKIVEKYTRKATSTSIGSVHSELVGDVAWSAVASQVKAAFAGFLQQLRLDILCSTAVICKARPDTSEVLINEVAVSFFTLNTEIYHLVEEVTMPLMLKAQATASAAVDITALSKAAAIAAQSQQQQQSSPGLRSSNYSASSASSPISPFSSSRRSDTQSASASSAAATSSQAQAIPLVTLSPNCNEYLVALRDTADPVIASWSVACRGNERLHRVHVEMLRGILSSTVLGLVRRHSLLVGAVRSIRDISQKYHRIVQGQESLTTIRSSVALVMGIDDKSPEPAGKLIEVDSVGRLLQETMASATVLKETGQVLRHWIMKPDDDEASSVIEQNSPTRKFSLDNPTPQKTAIAIQHAKTNSQYLIQCIKNLCSLVRRVATRCEKALREWSEPALNAFGKILEIHSAPLLQCARVTANAQTDMKQLIGFMRQKAMELDETRDIEDTLAVLSSNSSLVYSSFEKKMLEIENLVRQIHGAAQRSSAVLKEVVTTVCRPMSSTNVNSFLPFQYIDHEDQLLTDSLHQLCQQHDNIIDNLKVTSNVSYSSASTGLNPTQTQTQNNNNNTTASFSLQELTSATSGKMTSAEQRAAAASCSFDRLKKMCEEVDEACDRWFRSNTILSSNNTRNTTTTAGGGSSLSRTLSAHQIRKQLSISDNDGQTIIDDEQQLATVAASALLPPDTRNDDRIFVMRVLRGVIEHLESGEKAFLVVPRPDRVASASSLNEFEDEFSIAFVGVEGLCEQVFSAGNTGPISVTSASSLDVLARIGALASPVASASRRRSPSQDSRTQGGDERQSNAPGTSSGVQYSGDMLGIGGGSSSQSIHARSAFGLQQHQQRPHSNSSIYNRSSQQHQSSPRSMNISNINVGGTSTASTTSNTNSPYHQQSALASAFGTGSGSGNVAANLISSSNTNSQSNFQMPVTQSTPQKGIIGFGGGASTVLLPKNFSAELNISTSTPSTPSGNTSSSKNVGSNYNNNNGETTPNRRIPSYTSKAASEMPQHEVVLPSDYNNNNESS